MEVIRPGKTNFLDSLNKQTDHINIKPTHLLKLSLKRSISFDEYLGLTAVTLSGGGYIASSHMSRKPRMEQIF